MHSLAYQQNSGFQTSQLISAYQEVPRNNGKLIRIREAVIAWQKATPGKAQVYISQLVAAEWISRGGRGLLLAGSEHNTKQNFFRMINEPGPKNDKGLMQLIPVIIDVMARDNERIAREFGLVTGKTKDELLADAMKECSEASRSVLLNEPEHQKLKEVSEGIASLFRLIPEQVGPLISMVNSKLEAM